ncbi:hypothetical protein P171DRAFT_429957 [Karstenula rhodostoma CBS 690.94]|uniref:Uncharacterized protein n=1 Tax=Karstenula rhodostoma CBS 690.94 TaxID=1392251 RepID=A0A9P4PQ91_9PLEO|nr:hypothetical protein P171DRAFT_429957 [Karstenula rhodostoma CBS 690.94]
MQVTNANRQLLRTTQTFVSRITTLCLRTAHLQVRRHSTRKPPTRIARPSTATLLQRTTSAPHPRTFHTSPPARMSDADYEAFLNKANADSNEGKAQAQAQSEGYGTKSVNTAVPQALKSVEATYTSDADEPFEPVALNYQGDEITEQQLKTILSHNDEVEELSVAKWDPKGQYKNVVDTVKKVVDGEVKVFRVALSGAREEYYVVGVKDSKVLGLKALSVES